MTDPDPLEERTSGASKGDLKMIDPDLETEDPPSQMDVLLDEEDEDDRQLRSVIESLEEGVDWR